MAYLSHCQTQTHLTPLHQSVITIITHPPSMSNASKQSQKVTVEISILPGYLFTPRIEEDIAFIWIKTSINQSINRNLYSAPSRSLLNDTPEPGQLEKNSLDKVVELMTGTVLETCALHLMGNLFQVIGPTTEKERVRIVAERVNGTTKLP